VPIERPKKLKKKIVRAWIKEMEHIGKQERVQELTTKYEEELGEED
jgi:hypothetical protein